MEQINVIKEKIIKQQIIKDNYLAYSPKISCTKNSVETYIKDNFWWKNGKWKGWWLL